VARRNQADDWPGLRTIELIDVVRVGAHPVIPRQSFPFAFSDKGRELSVARARGVVQRSQG
jgi:hypothetical protein